MWPLQLFGYCLVLPAKLIISGVLLCIPLLFTAPATAFTGSGSCQGCHAEEFDLWKGSHHDLAMQLPSPDTVAMLLWALLASGQIQMRKVNGWEALAQPIQPATLDLAA